MKRQPVIRELQPLAPTTRRRNAAEAAWDRLAATLTHPDFMAVAAFSAIGLLLTLNVIMRFPDFAAMLQPTDLFP